MKKYQNRAGLIVAGAIPLFVLPARISEGQWRDPGNLIGSEIVIFLMSLACWHTIIYFQSHKNLKGWHKIVLSLLCCCVLSNAFFFTFNPIFKDFPFRTATNPLYIRILMLSSRGILMSVILIPGAYYVHKDLEARRAQREHQKLVLQRFEIENKLLEGEVFERTKALHYTLSSMQKTQRELEHQIYIQSRIIASFNHDIRGPFKFSIVVADKIATLAAVNGNHAAIHRYSNELNRSLKTTLTFVKNLLEFTKLPIRKKTENQKVNLLNLLQEKALLFEGGLMLRNNSLLINVNHMIDVESNYNLLGIVLHNIIDNANRYSDNGTIEINAATTDQAIELSVTNKGEPIQLHMIDWFNKANILQQLNDEIEQSEMYGIGLLLIKEISFLLGIAIRMDSDIYDTKVTLTFTKS